MRYVTLDTEKFVINLAPSPTTAAAIKRINSGIYREETLLQRITDIYKISRCEGILPLIFQTKNLQRQLNQAKKQQKMVASSDLLDVGMYRLDINYKKREREILQELNPKETVLLAKVFSILSYGGKLGSNFKDHPLKDYSVNEDVNVRYHQNLEGFRSFAIRKDPGFKRRQKQDPFAVSKAIICLYKPVVGVCDLFTLYNIGWHDDVYNYNVDSYDIVNPKQG